MAKISYNKLWENELYNIVSEKDKVQDMNINQLKLEVHDSYKKDEKLKTNFEPTDESHLINKAYLDGKLLKIKSNDGQIKLLEKHYNEFKLQYNKKHVQVVLVQRAVKTTLQKIFDKSLIDGFFNADKVLKDFAVCYQA